MRNLILAFGLISIIVLSGCGVTTRIAKETCNSQYYNIVVCPNLLERLVDTPPTTETTTEKPTKCSARKVESVRNSRFSESLVVMEGNRGCSEVFPELQQKLKNKPRGSECTYVDGEIECASMVGAIAMFLLFHLFGGLVLPRRESAVAIGLLTVLLLCVHSQAYGACTPNEGMSNKVAAQYGYMMYDCGRGEARQLDVSASIRAYFESKRYTKRLDENPGRLHRITAAFETVYGKEPIEVQKLALALCLKETGCGFSEASSWKVSGGKVVRSHAIYEREVYLSQAEACGIVQVATRGLKGECARLNSSFGYAFKAQLNWLRTHWNQGVKDDKGRLPKVDLYNFKSWQEGIKRGKNSSTTYYVYRYNGGGRGAWEYGRVIMQEIYPLMLLQERG